MRLGETLLDCLFLYALQLVDELLNELCENV